MPATHAWTPKILLMALLLVPLEAVWAWGYSGHRVVGDLAQRDLQPAVAEEVKALLEGEPEGNLAGVANWADQLRDSDPERSLATGPWHYVNFPPGDCRYQPARECADGACIIAAIQRNAVILGDRSKPRGERAEALKFLAHFVGDIHQPLHSGYRDDKGGNTFQISYGRDGWNLHSVWDTLLIESRGLDWRGYAEALAKDAARKPIKLDASWHNEAPIVWAEESCRIVQDGDIYPRKHKIKHAYLDEQRLTAERRLSGAGKRLAALLNSVLAAP